MHSAVEIYDESNQEGTLDRPVHSTEQAVDERERNSEEEKLEVTCDSELSTQHTHRHGIQLWVCYE